MSEPTREGGAADLESPRPTSPKAPTPEPGVEEERTPDASEEAALEATPEDPFAGVMRPLRVALERRGFGSLTPVQRAVLAADRPGQCLRISSQTGSGKTVALGLLLARDLAEPPVASRKGPEALVITPTRELATQVAEELRWLFAGLPKVDVVSVTGGTEVWKDKKPLAALPRVLVGTPGRLNDHLRSGVLSAESVRHVVLDEADQMLDMGFREEIDEIVAALPEDRQSHLVSATFPPAVRQLADRFQGQAAVHVAGTALGQANQDIQHLAYLVRAKESYAALVNVLLLGQGERTLVFVERRVDAQELTEMLAGDGFAALHLSGDLAQAQRTRTLNAFKAGVVSTLVCTDVAARGIDVPDITRVIHLGLPKDPDVYTHRSGRTGRAGRQGESVLIVPVTAERRVQRMLQLAKVAVAWRPAPSPERVLKARTKRARVRFHEALRAELGPSEAELGYAAGLLESEDPARVVATLLRLAEEPLPREPLTLGRVEARPAREAAPAGRLGAGAPGPEIGFVPFFINFGARSGANASRVIAHVCRRAGIEGRAIGAVRVEERMSVFEVRADLAQRFELAVRRPDPREPLLRIERFRTDSKRPGGLGGPGPGGFGGPGGFAGGPRRGRAPWVPPEGEAAPRGPLSPRRDELERRPFPARKRSVRRHH
ncbi:MAG: DEAD/DEAH box helicase [Polyangiaceae bacterium]|nr:DEAD/DEAH box helicase [Polyangiaceae bacterium]MCW5790924.1 DEAD/DEAH box helicase [Polyangiaceae bacterium]